MDKHVTDLQALHEEMAQRFGALSKLFGQLGSPEGARKLLESLTSGDMGSFQELIDGLDIPQLGKCFWVREIIERVIVTPTGLAEECSLRDNLTPEEQGLYIQIAIRHRQVSPLAESPRVLLQNARAVIPPGPFLEELKANGLADCTSRMTYDTSIALGLSKPEQICL